jgi:hypothetical protein
VQSFEKSPALRALASTQKEPPFTIAQLLVLAAFVVLTVIAVRRFRPDASLAESVSGGSTPSNPERAASGLRFQQQVSFCTDMRDSNSTEMTGKSHGWVQFTSPALYCPLFQYLTSVSTEFS